MITKEDVKRAMKFMQGQKLTIDEKIKMSKSYKNK